MTTTATSTVQVENDLVRVTEWRFGPNAATGFHRHEFDYVVVPLMSGRLKLIGADGGESFSDLEAGASYFRRAGVEHDVINASDGEFAFIEIELLSDH